MKSPRDKAKTARGTAAKSFGAQWLVVVTSASLISLFVVMPYTVGYFAYLDFVFLAFFSIADYYLFSALPIFTAILLICLQYMFSHMGVRYLKYSSRSGRSTQFPKIIVYAVPALAIAIALLGIYFEWRSGVLVAGFLVAGCLAYWLLGRIYVFPVLVAIVIALAFLVASYGLTIVAAAFATIVLLVYFSLLNNWEDRAFYVSVFIAAEITLAAWGYLHAHNRFVEPRKIDVLSQQPTDKADLNNVNLLFAGASGVLVFDDKMKELHFVHLDSGTTVRGNVIAGTDWLGKCFEPAITKPLRDYFSYKCLQFKHADDLIGKGGRRAAARGRETSGT